jgi:hypothetical protein
VCVFGTHRLLRQPELHELDLEVLVGDNLLCEPTHLRVFAIQQLHSGHVDGSLVMRQHQSDEVNVCIPGSFDRRHVVVHLQHASDQSGPMGIIGLWATR